MVPHQGPTGELPLTGPPSLAGGRTLGPVFYWLFWLGRVIVGPFTDNLPHAGGIVVATLQTIGDTCLLWVLLIALPLGDRQWRGALRVAGIVMDFQTRDRGYFLITGFT